MLIKNRLLFVFCALSFCLLMVNPAFACDTTPIITPSNVQSVGGGNYSVDVQVCVGINGSIDGFSTSINCGLSVVGLSPLVLNNGANVAAGTFSGNTVNFNCATCNSFNWFAADDGISGPCFNFTMVVNGDPANCALTTTGINDGCLIIQTSWDAQIPGPCVTSGSMTAPGTFSGNTTTSSNICNLRASNDQIIEINLPCNDTWTVSLCGGASWDTYLYVGTACCSGTIGLNDDFCGLQSSITQNMGPGTIYATVEGFSTFSTGSYTLSVTQANSCPLDLNNVPLAAVPDDEENVIDLSWEVDADDDNDVAFYYVERSIGDGPFTTLESLEPNGSNSGKALYNIRDWRVKENEIYNYRLHIHTLSGEQYDSEVVTARLAGSEGLLAGQFYPNPASGETRIDLQSGQEGFVSTQIYDVRGRVIANRNVSVHAGSGTTVFDLNGIGSGIYFVRMTDADQNTLLRKLVVK